MATSEIAAAQRKPGFVDILKALGEPHVRIMLLLGFSSGLPFLLSFGTLSAWLATANVDIKTIGMMSLTNFAYSFKFLWAPAVDNVPIPFLSRWLGRRRAWMLLAQAGIVGSLIGLSGSHPENDLGPIVLFAILLAFSSATQDIAIDAWRIEAAPVNQQALMAGVTNLGYRLGLLTAGAGALMLSTRPSWGYAYLIMAACVGVGMIGALFAKRTPEPKDPVAGEETVAALAEKTGLHGAGATTVQFLYRAIVAPFIDFFAQHGIAISILILLLIGLYSIADRVLGVMANPFYLHQGFTRDEIAIVSKTYGIWISIAGAVLGGLVAMRIGPRRALILGSALGASAHLSMAWLATQGHSVPAFFVAISFENALGGFSGTVLIAFISSLTNIKFSGTQYALFSSFAAMPGKFAGAGSGYLVDYLGGFYQFFLATAAMGLPGLILILILLRVTPSVAPAKPAIAAV